MAFIELVTNSILEMDPTPAPVHTSTSGGGGGGGGLSDLTLVTCL